MKTTYNTIYTDLDSLQDTRLGILYQIDKEATDKAVISGEYGHRRDDIFDFVDYLQFKDLYTHRDKTVLLHSPPTQILNLVIDHVLEVVNNYQTETLVVLPKVMVNIYPYELLEAEVEVIKLGLTAKFKGKVEIDVVRLSPSEMTPEYVKSNIDTIIAYHGVEWLDVHTEGMKDISKLLPEVSLIVPRLSVDRIDDEDTFYKTFDDLSVMLKPIIDISFIKPIIFSAIYAR